MGDDYMAYFIGGIIIGLIVTINGFIQVKKSAKMAIVSICSGLGLIAVGTLGLIFKELELVFIILLIVCVAFYSLYSWISDRKLKK